MIEVPAGQFIAGSTPEEREQAYDDHAAAVGDGRARVGTWFAQEQDRHVVREVPAYRIDLLPVSNAAYAEYVRDTGAAAPRAPQQPATGSSDQLLGWGPEVAEVARRAAWQNGEAPVGRGDHPVVLVSWQQARDYCAWRGGVAGAARRLPSADEFEKASRGPAGRSYPWGNSFDAERLHSAASEPPDTVPVGAHSNGASEYGVLEIAGNVFQWTGTRWPHDAERMTLKGSAWDRHAGFGRGASALGRGPADMDPRIGFRCAADAP